MIFNHEINTVTVDQSIQWITKSFKEIKNHPKIFAINVASVWAITACIDLFANQVPYAIFLYVIYFCIFGTVILNLDSVRTKQKYLIGFYEGFKLPFVSRLLRSGFFFFLGMILCISFSLFFLYTKDFFAGDHIEQLQSVTQKLSSPVALKKLEEILTSTQKTGQLDLYAFQQIFPNVDLATISSMLQQLMIALQIFLLLFLILFSYFWLVPYFCTLCYEDLKLKKINMYALSFKVAFSFKNWIPLISFSVAIGLIVLIYNICLNDLVQLISIKPLQIVVDNFKGAISTCFILYALYFMFFDLFMTKEEDEVTVADEVDPKNEMAPTTEIKKF